MKTKIFVCSNSGIDYIPHSENISTIPVILRLSEEEQYEDYLDFNTEAFYNRFRMDKNVTIIPTFQNYAKICEYISTSKQEGYDQILFILASKEFGDLYIPISIAISENKDIPCQIYNSNTCCFPLAYMAIEANEMFMNNALMSDVIERLDKIQKNHHIFFFKPQSKNEWTARFSNYYKKGTVFTLENGLLCPMDKEKGVLGYNLMLSIFSKETANKNIIPFVLYSSKTSKYIGIIEESLIEISSLYRKAKAYAIPPAVGIQTGATTLGLGYIVKS